jgi:hypothetical protein
MLFMPATQGSTNRRSKIQAVQGIKITNTERAGGVAQVVQYLPSKHKGSEHNSQY